MYSILDFVFPLSDSNQFKYFRSHFCNQIFSFSQQSSPLRDSINFNLSSAFCLDLTAILLRSLTNNLI